MDRGRALLTRSSSWLILIVGRASHMETKRQSGTPKWVWIAVSAFVVVALAIGFVVHRFMAARELCTYFDRLRPGMTYAEVIQLIPPGMIHSDKQSCTSVVWQTVLARSNALPASEVYCYGPVEPLPGIEAGWIYFDQEDRLIGAWYSSSGVGPGIWKPHWGVRYE
jgi:hypothetical protein